MKYSKSTNGFYDPAINTSIPADTVDVPYATYQALLAGQSAGQVIAPDANGDPVLSAPVVTLAQARRALQTATQLALDHTDLVALRCFKAGVAFPAAWQAYTVALRAIASGVDTTSTVLPAQPAYPAGT